jgi:uncharacterized membrane protein YebE (DUF533 family)
MAQRMTAFTWLGWELFELPSETATAVTEEENLAYAKAIMVCAAGDGEIAPKERDWILGFLTTADVPEEVVKTMETYDGSNAIEDLDRILAAADRMRLPRDVVDELEQIVHEEEGLRKRRHKLIVADAFAEVAA